MLYSSVPTPLRAADGTALHARRFTPDGAMRARLIVAGATGVAQGFYRRFALHAASRGFETLALDYRGIGHMGYFRPQAEALWTRALDWFDGLAPQREQTPCLA